MKRLFTMIVLAMVLVGLAFSAEAGVKKIRPDQLKVLSTGYSYYQSPKIIFSTSGACFWSTVVKLPLGKRITKLKYYHLGSGTCSTNVHLFRVKMGEQQQQIAIAESNDASGIIIPVENVSAIEYPKIRTGYSYYVTAGSSNSDSKIYGIKIFYK